MSVRTKLLALLASALCVAGCSGGTDTGEATGAAAAETLRFAMVPKGTTHVFWTAVERGAQRAADDLGIELVWKGPLEENDRAQQIQVVQQLVGLGVDALLVAPLDRRALLGPVRAARDAGVPVLVFDSGLDGEPGRDFVSFVATNNVAAGRMGGERLAKLLGGTGKIVLLRYLVGSASTTNREEGFLEAAHAAGLEVLVENRHAGASAGEAKTEALNMIDQLRAADGVFCSNESATMGMLLALRQEGLLDELAFVGFDASPALVAALEAGEIDALVVQDPERMGELSVRTMMRHLAGEEIEATIDTGAVLATPANMRDPEIAVLLR